MKLEVEDIPECKAVCVKESVDCRCKELEEICQEKGERCLQLELELKKMRAEYQALEDKVKAYEADKLYFEKELEDLKRLNSKFKNQTFCFEGNSQIRIVKNREQGSEIVELLEETDDCQLLQLMTENKVLEIEKKKAVSDAEIWKRKYMDLELCVLQTKSALQGGSVHVDEKVKVATEASDLDSHSARSRGSELNDNIGFEFSTGRNVKQQLSFKEERNPRRKMVPSTPAAPISASVIIDLSDSDSEPLTYVANPASVDLASKKEDCISTHSVPGEALSGEDLITSRGTSVKVSNRRDVEVQDDENGNLLSVSTPKRKRTLNMVTSDIDSDDEDDKVPIFKKMHPRVSITNDDKTCLNGLSLDTSPVVDNMTGAATPKRRRLRTLGQIEQKGMLEGCTTTKLETGKTKYCQGIPTAESVEDDDSEECQSDSEGDSLDEFIVDSSDDESGDDESASSKPVDESDKDADFDKNESEDDVDFGEILSQLQRRKNDKLEWEFEADMLAALGKDPKLCMKAVCALYRQQTSEEKADKKTYCNNGRGFNKLDAHRYGYL